ncbi:hypothetical protein CS063_05790 [Sporanaerobium hydrogeniformans]|uniref:Uncharacterized protein n=1 Tax=Sporanaerobium hydrogeniformans TaxID=3072179 RepID=A0AC61DE74_9FIRM|nr:hypothetical protein [Sporanaerobium hydrogeniformans]PHV71202.1 hypothetical protein CS063_05790 [Sporanaerobium hydrogeniformans]
MKGNEALFIMRQNVIKLFKQYEYILLPSIRFVIAVLAINLLITTIGYVGPLSKIPLVLFMALLATFLPDKWMILGCVIIIPLFLISSNLILSVIVFICLWVMYLLFMRLFPKESLLIIGTILCFSMGLEILVPVLAALFGSYVSIIAILLGVILWFVMPQMAISLQTSGTSKGEMIDVLTRFFTVEMKGLFAHKTMLCTMVIFFIVFSIIYIIRRQALDYAPYIAISIGAVMNLAGFGLAILFLDMNVGMLSVVLMTILVTLVATICQFFSIALDYQRAEIVSFEDEENYYHVKVIPKIQVSTSNTRIKTIYNTKTENKDYIEDILNSRVHSDKQKLFEHE